MFIDDKRSLTGQQLGRLKVYDAQTALKLMRKQKLMKS